MFGVYGFLSANARLYPEATAIVKDGTRWSYRELDARICRLASSLWRLGVRKGQRVGFMFRNGNAFVEIFYAIQKLGAVGIPFCFMFGAKELADNLRLVDCACFLFDERYLPLVREIKGDVPALQWLIHSGTSAGPGELLLDDLIRGGDPEWSAVETAGSDEEALILFTSGTTGASKAVVHTQETLLLFVVLPMMGDCSFFRDDVMLYYAPLYHLAGIAYTLYMMTTGGTFVLTEGFHADTILALIQRERVTQTFLIPPNLIRYLRESPLAPETDLRSVRYVIMSGGGNAPQYGEQVFELFPNAVICNTYGHSERAANTILYLTREEYARDPQRITSVGRATQSSELRLVDEQGREAALGEAYARCPGMFKGYLNRGDPFVDGWFPTGDILRRDESGSYYFVDRKKDMIKTGGENVYALEVENVIRGHPLVEACAVVGLPDPVFSEAVTAAVVPKGDALLTEDEIVAFCRERMATFKKPREVYFVEALPKSAVGKVQKAVLRDQLLALRRERT